MELFPSLSAHVSRRREWCLVCLSLGPGQGENTGRARCMRTAGVDGTEMHCIEWKGMNDWMDGWTGWSNRDNANKKARKQTNSV